MPPPNLTTTTALTLTEGLTTQQVDEGGVVFNVFYKYANATDEDEVISLGVWGVFPPGYRPFIRVWVDEDQNVMVHESFANGSFTLPIPAGFTYWFEVRRTSGNTTPANLSILFQIETVNNPDAGVIFISSASISEDNLAGGLTGLHGGFIDTDLEEIIGFVPQFVTGEGGDILPTSGRLLYGDEFGSGPLADVYGAAGPVWALYMFDGDFNELKRFTFVSPSGAPLIRTHFQSEKFYVYAPSIGSNVPTYVTVDQDGVVSDVFSVGTGDGLRATAIAASLNEDIIYIGKRSGTVGEIERWDVASETFLSELATALTDRLVIDLLVMNDGTIISGEFKTTATRDIRVRRYSPDGTVLNTYTPTFSSGLTDVTPRLGYSTSNEDAFWLFSHLDTAYNDFRLVQFSDMTELKSFEIPNVFQQEVETDEPIIPTTSDSCPIVELAVAGGASGGAAGLGVIGPLAWVEFPRRIPSDATLS